MTKEKLRSLGVAIRKVRREAKWSGREVARRSGVPQATVSRVENGQRVDDVNTVERVIAALPISSDAAGPLLAKVRDAYSEVENRRADAGVSLVRDTARRWEKIAITVREFQSGMVPRGLRSPEYAQAADVSPSSIVDRFGDTGCGFGFVVTEGALRTWPADGAVMPDQLDRVARAGELPNVRLGVVPWSVPLPVMLPHGFSVFDDEAVVVETFTAQMTITEPDSVAAYVDAYAQLEAVAVTGDEAAELLARIRRDFEELTH
ncbi:helix-turn-helix domain-containing protein [Streptomonospora algeriensis]|uniref:Helix-turn-helix domain-containing protein n=1 Tax=Streptomonospora algeriensis TaxID=995084 RepID=A0ABW3BAK8_9ACTN